MDGFVIKHRLDLALQVMDTTTGRPVSGSVLRLYRDGKLMCPLEKERGMLVFSEMGRDDFTLSISSREYEQQEIPIHFAEIDENYPLLLCQLIPSAANYSPTTCLSLVGKLPGISQLTAVRMGDNSCLIREFDPKKKNVTLFNPHKLELDRIHYALVDPEKKCYERFKILQRIDDNTVKIDRVLETEFGNYFPITSVLFGKTGEDGSYCLRVRDNSSSASWLVSYRLDDQSYYQIMDLRQEHSIAPPRDPEIKQKE
ncbi:MAG: hypothetical protein RSC51_01745 [Oscillospiraceae bacterium]